MLTNWTLVSSLILLIMLTAFSRFLFRQTPKTLHLASFKEQRIVTDDTYNGIPNGDTHIKYVNENDKPVCDIMYRVTSGYIGVVRSDAGYRGRGLEEQMLQNAIKEMQKAGVSEVWEVVTEHNKFWSNIKGAVYSNPVSQCSGTGTRRCMGMGYSLKI